MVDDTPTEPDCGVGGLLFEYYGVAFYFLFSFFFRLTFFVSQIAIVDVIWALLILFYKNLKISRL